MTPTPIILLLLLSLGAAGQSKYPVIDSVRWIHVDRIKQNTTIYDNGWPIGYIGNTDTLPNGPVVFTVQPCRNCALTWIDGYLIGGEPYTREHGKMVRRKWYRWDVKH